MGGNLFENASGMGEDFKVAAAYHSHERHTAFFGVANRQRRRCGNGGEDRGADAGGLLHEFDGDAARHQHDALRGREALPRQRAGKLVEGVVTADVFALLEEYGRAGRRFDLIILDPPSFAKAKQNRFAALRAYVRLNQMALACLEPGGLLATASCTSQVSPDAFRQTLADAGAAAGRRVLILHEAGQPLDHPAPAGFPEGRYLKFIIAQASEWG